MLLRSATPNEIYFHDRCPCACGAPCCMKMVESHPEGWSQGRSLLSAVSLDVRLTWMLFGTLFCDHHLVVGSTRISFSTNRHLTSQSVRLLSLERFVMQVVHSRCAGLDVHKKSVVAAVRLLAADGSLTTQVRSFGTTT